MEYFWKYRKQDFWDTLLGLSPVTSTTRAKLGIPSPNSYKVKYLLSQPNHNLNLTQLQPELDHPPHLTPPTHINF
jgi:hypothetical protein